MATVAEIQARYVRDVNQCIYANTECGVTVYKGEDRLSPSKPIAWKERICDFPTCESLNRAYSLQREIQHASVCEVLCFFHESISPSHYRHVLITPLYATDLNKELNHRRRKARPWQEDELMHILFSMVSCLAHCQEIGKSHRDIKPANIFMDQGHLKIGDFETARAVEGFSKQYTLAGTMPYLSPALRADLAAGRMRSTHDPVKSDVYSLGVTMLELALLQRPDLNTIYRLEERITQFLSKLRSPSLLRSLLSKMLIVDEAARPDFIALLPYFSTSFTTQTLRRSGTVAEQCSACRANATCFCLCTFPVLTLCANCVERHRTEAKEEHATIGISQIGDWNREEKVTTARKKVKTYGEIQKEFKEISENIAYMEQATKDIYKHAINSLNSLLDKDLRFLVDYKAKVTNLQTQYQLLLEAELKGQISLQSVLSGLPRPFFRCNLTARPEIASKSPVFISITESLGQLCHIQDPQALPIPTINNRLYLWRPQAKEWIRSEIKSDVSLDEATIFTSVSDYEIVGVGGIKKPKQAFLLDIFNGNIRELSEMSQGRSLPGGVICVNWMVYVFGGESLANSERISVHTNEFYPVKIADMPEIMDNFNPAHWSDKIYIPGINLWAYDIAADSFQKKLQLRGSSQLVSSIVVSNCLYIFTFDGSATVDLSRNKVKTDDRFAVEIWSNPSPCCIGEYIYLICKADAEILRIDISTFEKSRFNCPFPSHAAVTSS